MNDYDEIVAQICKSLRPFADGQGVELGEDTELVNELGLSSTQVMEMVLALEEELDLSIPLNSLANVTTVRDLASLIQKLNGSA